MHDVRLLSVGLQYVTFRLIKHMVDGRMECGSANFKSAEFRVHNCWIRRRSANNNN